MLQVSLDKTNQNIVVIAADDDVDLALWDRLCRGISRKAVSKNHELRVPLHEFLRATGWMADAINHARCDLEITPDVERSINGSRQKADEVRGLLRGGEEPPDDDGPVEVGGRFVQSPQHELKPFQRRNLRKLLRLSNGAEFSVPGAGKTGVAYACYEASRVAGQVQRLLVIAPLSAWESWRDEAVAWFNPTPVVSNFDGNIPFGTEVLIVNYQRLASQIDLIAHWVQERPTHVILDESHNIKASPLKEWGAACIEISYFAARRDILSGTPAPHLPKDLVSQISFLWGDEARRILPKSIGARVPTPGLIDDVSKRIATFFARTTKTELGLRPPELHVEPVTMKPLQKEIYDVVRGDLSRLTHADRRAFIDLRDVTMYLLEAATNPALLSSPLGGFPQQLVWPPRDVPNDASLVEKVQRYLQLETPAKFEKLLSIVEANKQNRRKTLVWTRFIGNITQLSTRLLLTYNPALFYGERFLRQPSGIKSRDEELDRFRNDPNCWVLIANPQAMAEGVSLHKACHDAVYLDRDFNAGKYLQSLDRIHRLGLDPDEETRITFLVAGGTIDDVVNVRLQRKTENLALMLDDQHLVTMALPGDDDEEQVVVDQDDIQALLQHLSDV
jgi:SNF2 family DNA or RNA helicase